MKFHAIRVHAPAHQLGRLPVDSGADKLHLIACADEVA